MRDEHREIIQAQAFGVENGHRVGGRGGLETDTEEDHLALRILLGDLHGVERRVNNANMAALALDF